MANELDYIFDMLEKGIGLANTVQAAKDSQNKYENLSQTAEYTQFLKDQSTYKKNLLSQESANLKADYTDSQGDVLKLVEELKLWGITRDVSESKIQEQFQTDEAKEIINENNLELNSDLTWSMKNLGSIKKNLLNLQQATIQNRQVEKVLDKMLDSIYKLRDVYGEVGSDQGVKGIIDLMDINATIEKNKDIFFNKTIGDEGEDIFSENYLATAFRQPKEKGPGSIYRGYVPKYTEGGAEGALAGTEEGKWNDMMGQVFRDIGSTENVLSEFSKKPAGRFFTTSGGKVKDYMGTKEMYADEKNALRLKNELEGKISKIIVWGEDLNMESKDTPGSILNIANQAKVTPDNSNALIRRVHDKVMPIETNQSLYGTGWTSEDMTGIDLRKGWGPRDQKLQEELIRKYLKAWNLIDVKYPGQWTEYK